MTHLIFAGLYPMAQKKILNRAITQISYSKPVMDLEAIASIVCHEYGITLFDIKSKSQVAIFNEPRQIAMYLMWKNQNTALKKIGDYFFRHHSTVIHSRDTVMDRCDTEINYRIRVNKLWASL